VEKIEHDIETDNVIIHVKFNTQEYNDEHPNSIMGYTKYEYKTAQLIVYFSFIFHHKNEL